MSSLRLDKNVVHSLKISQVEDENDDGKVSFSYETHFSEVDKNEFSISFEITILSKSISIEVNYVSYFICDEDIPEDKHDSNFFNVNAPAIGYPFLRAYVANLMLSSGYAIFMMPTINFVALSKEKTKRIEKEI